jgi:hypothetical protein
MTESMKKVALLISYHKGDRNHSASRDAVILYESLTCDGSIGPSDIIMLAKEDIPYSDGEPTLNNIRRAFVTLGHRASKVMQCLVLLDGNFDMYGMDVMDQVMDLDEISAFIESLSCTSVQVFLSGPRSDQASERLQAPGRVLVYSSRMDGEEKLDDPFHVSGLFQGDEVLLSRVRAERIRLASQGHDLNWIR